MHSGQVGRKQINLTMGLFEIQNIFPGSLLETLVNIFEKVSFSEFLRHDGDDDDDKPYLTTLTLSAKAGFHNGRVKY